jgi:hypothetical protein
VTAEVGHHLAVVTRGDVERLAVSVRLRVRVRGRGRGRVGVGVWGWGWGLGLGLGSGSGSEQLVDEPDELRARVADGRLAPSQGKQ